MKRIITLLLGVSLIVTACNPDTPFDEGDGNQTEQPDNKPSDTPDGDDKPNDNTPDGNKPDEENKPTDKPDVDMNTVIAFVDPATKEICIKHWDTDGNGEITYGEADAVTDLGNAFYQAKISTFHEFKYFTGITRLGNSAFSACSMVNIELPSSLKTIGEFAFMYSGLTTITIPSNVTSIEYAAFGSCNSLKSTSILGTPTIDANAFSGDQALEKFTGPMATKDRRCLVDSNGTLIRCAHAGLTEYTIPEGVTTIGAWAFDNSIDLKKISIPHNVTTIEDNAFSSCRELTSIVIPNSVTSIGKYAFDSCNAATSIIIPASITTISEGAFQFCTSLTSMVIPTSITTIGAWAFSGCSALTNITIPEGVTTIDQYAFSTCDALTSITLPASITSLGENILLNCKGVTSIYCKSTTPPTVSKFALKNPDAKVYVPREAVIAYQTSEGWIEIADKIEGCDF